MIVRPRPQIVPQRLQQLRAVLAPANQRQVEGADGPLAEEIAQPRARKVADMQVGDVGQSEHQASHASIWISANNPKWSETYAPSAAG